uniref:Uncharacterized protein n=1 Tax=Nelumbo nucifera TaxID=4432 RepID=A0A822YQM7_NELNU|nr:TPA_asm: hypothetical protein HUJ06_005457 [Nelumbo nucifera]
MQHQLHLNVDPDSNVIFTDGSFVNHLVASAAYVIISPHNSFVTAAAAAVGRKTL